MILSDKTILERIQLKKDLIIKPLNFNDIQPCSIDLHLASSLKTIQGKEYNLKPCSCLILEPGEFILGSTKEYVEIPDDLVGIVDGKSSIGRLGITAHVTAGYIDAGFKGNIVLEIKNLSPNSILLYEGMRVCQIVFEELNDYPNRIYGEADNKYQKSTDLKNLE